MEKGFAKIDLDRWPRREHYEFFKQYAIPFFSITSSIDVGPLRRALKERGVPFTVGLLHTLSRAANSVAEFRQRIREDAPIEHRIVHPGVTVLCEEDVFRFCFLRYDEDFDRFATEASAAMEAARAAESLVPESIAEGEGSLRDDLLYCTSLPWFSFTGMFHPLRSDPLDSVPRIAWGRFEESGSQLVMPLNVQAHHALIDGIHIARFIKRVEDLIGGCDTVPLPEG